MILLRLPVPPSANNLFANVSGKGRVKTKVYRLWLQEAGWMLKQQSPEHIAGPIKLSIVVARGSPKSDIDNRLKGLLDLLVEHQVITDDSLVEELYIRWAVKGSGVQILIEPFVPTVFQPEVAA